jgi:hypothetical protein
MHQNLLNILVDRGIVHQGTQIEAMYVAAGLDGCFTVDTTDLFSVLGAKKTADGNVILILSRLLDNAKLNVSANMIITIDGMPPRDLADAFDLKEDGSKKELKLDEFGNPVRRGRKPKHLKQEQGNMHGKNLEFQSQSSSEANRGIGTERTAVIGDQKAA